jgi:hypothetical protein
MTIDAVMPADILFAIKRDDLDDAVRYVQTIAGVDSGDVASQVFAGFDWRNADLRSRQNKMLEYVKAERTYAGAQASAFTVENYAALDFLMRSLEDLGFSQHLPRVMDGARDAMAALRKAYPLAEQYAQQQKRKLA